MSKEGQLFEQRLRHRQHEKRLPVAGKATDQRYALLLEKAVNRKAQRRCLLEFFPGVEEAPPIVRVSPMEQRFPHPVYARQLVLRIGKTRHFLYLVRDAKILPSHAQIANVTF